jgi:hypothetical protein
MSFTIFLGKGTASVQVPHHGGYFRRPGSDDAASKVCDAVGTTKFHQTAATLLRVSLSTGMLADPLQ